MTWLFLTFASLLSLFGLILHVTRGRRLIVAPLTQCDMHEVPRNTLIFSWNWGAVTMAMLALGFISPLWRPDFMPLAMFCTVYAYWLGVASFVQMRRGGFSVAQMPQWVLFWSVSALGFLSWGLG